MSADLYVDDDAVFVYRVWDPVEKKFCRSGRSLYAQNTKSFWPTKGGATTAKNNMPLDIRGRLVVKKYRLEEER